MAQRLVFMLLLVPSSEFRLEGTESISPVLYWDIFGLLPCSDLVADGSEFAQGLLQTLLGKSFCVSVGRELGSLPPSSLILLASNLSLVTMSDPEVVPNPKNKIVTVLRDDVPLPEVTEAFYSYRRSTFLYINVDKKGESKYYTFENMTHMMEISLEEAKKLFLKDFENKIKNFNGKKIIVSTFNCTIYSQVGELAENNQPSWLDGYEMSTLIRISPILNINLEILVPREGVKWGVLLKNGTWTEGIIRYAMDWEVDISVCGIWHKPTQIGKVEMSDAWEEHCHRYIVPRPKLVTSRWAGIFRVFSAMVWISIVAVYILVVATLWTLANIQLNWFQSIYRSLGRSVLQMYGLLLLSNYPHYTEARGSLTALFASWLWFSFLMATAFSSNLVALLTSPDYTEKVETIGDFINQNYFWGKPSDDYADLIFDLTDPVQKKWRYDHFRVENNPNDRITRMKSGFYVIDGESMRKIFFFSETGVPVELYDNFEAASKCQYKYFTGYMFPLGSPLFKSFNLLLSRLRTAGILDKWYEEMLNSNKILSKFIARDVFKFTRDTRESRSEALGVRSLQGPFSLLVAGLSLAFVVFLIEVLFSFIVLQSKTRTYIQDYTLTKAYFFFFNNN